MKIGSVNNTNCLNTLNAELTYRNTSNMRRTLVGNKIVTQI